MYTIVGSGFGLYGYLPAIARHLNQPVVLPKSYQPKVEARPELRDCIENVRWVANRGECLRSAGTVVIALPPLIQSSLVDEVLPIGSVATVILEKPVANTPAAAAEIQSRLQKSGKRIGVNYSFWYTRWFDLLRSHRAGENASSALAVEWNFRAHHFTKNTVTWKQNDDEGGGAIRFFGIHLIAVAAALGYETVDRSIAAGPSLAAPARWSATFSNDAAQLLDINVETNSDTFRFAINSIHGGKTTGLVNGYDPFSHESATYPGEDLRVPAIARMLRAAEAGDMIAAYDRAIALWDRVERQTTRA